MRQMAVVLALAACGLASVAGATAYRESYGRKQQVPLRVEPRGIIEPFGWLMTELDENWNNPSVAARLCGR